jgi:hypothetical protein
MRLNTATPNEWQLGLALATNTPRTDEQVAANSAWQIALMLIDRSLARPEPECGRTVALLSDGDQ